MSGTPLEPKLREAATKRTEELLHMLPVRCWVEGDGKMYGQFADGSDRRRLSELDVLRMLHVAHEKANMIFSAIS